MKTLFHFILVVLFISNQNNFLIAQKDTIIVDERFDEVQFYLHQYYDENGHPVFKDVWGGDDNMILYLNKNNKPFTGVLEILSLEKKYVCTFKNGIPHGTWKRYSKNWRKKDVTDYDLLDYIVEVNEGFVHGDCIIYEDGVKNRIRAKSHFENGYVTGQYLVNVHQYVQTELEFKVIDKTKAYYNYLSKIHQPLEDRKQVDKIDIYAICYARRDDYYSLPLGSFYFDNSSFVPVKLGCKYSKIEDPPAILIYPKSEYIDFTFSCGTPRKHIYRKTNWKDGLIMRFEEYQCTELDTSIQNDLIMSEDYIYKTGYVIVNSKKYYHYKNNERFFFHPLNEASEKFSDWDFAQADESYFGIDTSFWLNTSYIQPFNGSEFNHGNYLVFESDGEIENDKIKIEYQFAEGEYSFGKKTGVWKYYLFYNGKKKLVCTTTYKKINVPNLIDFKIGQPYQKFCNYEVDYSIPDEVLHGYQYFYNLDGSIYIGFKYDNGQIIGVVKK